MIKPCAFIESKLNYPFKLSSLIATITDTIQQAMLLVERIPCECNFNLASVGVGPGIECFPDYRSGSKTNKELALYFLKVHVLRRLVLFLLTNYA